LHGGGENLEKTTSSCCSIAETEALPIKNPPPPQALPPSRSLSLKVPKFPGSRPLSHSSPFSLGVRAEELIQRTGREKMIDG